VQHFVKIAKATLFSVAFTLKNIANIYLINLIFGLIDYISLIRNLPRQKWMGFQPSL